jgi:hypothetical protein
MAGRLDEYEGTIEVDKIIERVCAGAPLRDVTMEVAKKAITVEMDAATKVQWLKDNLDEIRSMGSDTEKAWRNFCSGRTDALASTLEEAVLEGVMNQIEDEDEEEDEDEDEEGDEDEEDDSDDDDEDEDEED